MGPTIDQQSDILLGTLFIYNKFELADLVHGPAEAGLDRSQRRRFAAAGSSETTGPALGKPYDPAQVTYRQVGNMTIEFGDAAHRSTTYTIDGAGAVKQITRLTFAPNPIVGSYVGATSDITYDCTDPARNGIVTTDPGPFTITQEPDGDVLKFRRAPHQRRVCPARAPPARSTRSTTASAERSAR